jgi:hypothetical protein
LVKLLLESGAGVNTRDLYGQTPLHNAANCEYDGFEDGLAMAKLLLEAEAEVDAKASTDPFNRCHDCQKTSLFHYNSSLAVIRGRIGRIGRTGHCSRCLLARRTLTRNLKPAFMHHWTRSLDPSWLGSVEINELVTNWWSALFSTRPKQRSNRAAFGVGSWASLRLLGPRLTHLSISTVLTDRSSAWGSRGPRFIFLQY